MLSAESIFGDMGISTVPVEAILLLSPNNALAGNDAVAAVSKDIDSTRALTLWIEGFICITQGTTCNLRSTIGSVYYGSCTTSVYKRLLVLSPATDNGCQ